MFSSKYAFYVWGSYGISFFLLGAEVLMLWMRKRNLARREQTANVTGNTPLNASLQGIQ